MCGGMYGYCGGSKLGLHQFPIMKKNNNLQWGKKYLVSI